MTPKPSRPDHLLAVEMARAEMPKRNHARRGKKAKRNLPKGKS
ncbi:hypothetical protein RSAG8_05735, partial [Rhizoctonia solani AG-8 WAC10335]